MWKWHRLLSAFVALFGLGMAIASIQFGGVFGGVAHPLKVQATSSDNLMGWMWADPIGWASMNDQNAGSCSGSCGSYGVNVDPSTRQITGWAWNDSVGWICFGSFCTNASCQNDPGDPAGATNAPDGGAPYATMDASGSPVQIHGWAKVCSEGSKGWISLNCADMGLCGGAFAYKVVYDPSSKSFFTGSHPPPANYSSMGWNGFSDGTGLGYVDFQYVTLNAPAESLCSDGIDNDFNGLTDCADPACTSDPVCARTESQCSSLTPTGAQIHACCSNGVDDTVPANGLIDCADPDCAAKDPACAPPAVTESQCTDAMGNPLGAHACCSNGVDDTVPANGLIDCADPDCQAMDPLCTPAWLSTQFGNVYAQQGITGSSLKSSTATYCLTSNGTITGFSSDKGCLESNTTQQLTLPTTGSGYQGTLGSLDVNGILAGHYGTVVELGANVDVTPFLTSGSLGGKVYHATGNVTLDAATFQNGTGPTDRGSGLLIVEGNLTITGNSSYASTAGIQYLRDLASFGVIVKQPPGASSGGGDIMVAPGVSSLVGAYFAEDTISTGSFCAVGAPTCPADGPLTVAGLLAAHQLDLERDYRNPTTPAETVSFDGRAVANPPPGMQDVSKSLPTASDAF